MCVTLHVFDRHSGGLHASPGGVGGGGGGGGGGKCPDRRPPDQNVAFTEPQRLLGSSRMSLNST
jgi:hypothetical protein